MSTELSSSAARPAESPVESAWVQQPFSAGRVFGRAGSARCPLGLSVLWVWLPLLGAIGACTRTSIPLSGGALQTASATQAQDVATVTSAPTSTPPTAASHAVVWMAEGEYLQIHEAAGIAAVVIDELAWDRNDIVVTGNVSLLGSSAWAEIHRSGEGTGWVKSWNLTEYVPGDAFCADHRVNALVAAFGRSVLSGGATQLAELVSPKRGLVIRHDPWNPEVRLGLEELPRLFVDRKVRHWGTRYVSRTPIEGSFDEVVRPKLVEVFSSAQAQACNRVLVGVATEATDWPDEYTNLNFYSLHRSPAPGENPYDWRTWAIGVEYVDSRPYIAVLVLYQPQA